MNGDGTYTGTLICNGAIVGTATATCMQDTAPAYVSIGHTGNINPSAIVRYTSLRVFAGDTADLAGAVLAICKRGGVTDIDVSGLGSTPLLGYGISK